MAKPPERFTAPGVFFSTSADLQARKSWIHVFAQGIADMKIRSEYQERFRIQYLIQENQQNLDEKALHTVETACVF